MTPTVTPSFAMFDRVANDPRLRGQSAWVRWTWLAVLRLAAESPVPGHLLRLDRTSIHLSDIQSVAKHEHAQPALDVFKRAGMIALDGKHYHVVDWDSWVKEEESGGDIGGVSGGSRNPLSKTLDLATRTHSPLAAATQQQRGRVQRGPLKVKKPGDDTLVNLSTHREMVNALGGLFNAQVQPEWSRCAKAAKILLSATPPAEVDELPGLKSAFERMFPNATCTELAIANRLGGLRRAPEMQRGKRETSTSQIDRVSQMMHTGGGT